MAIGFLDGSHDETDEQKQHHHGDRRAERRVLHHREQGGAQRVSVANGHQRSANQAEQP
jgi:hypothetical protein